MGLNFAMVLHPELRSNSSKRDPEKMLEEVILLAEAVGLRIAYKEIVNLKVVRASSFFGKGIITKLAETAFTCPTA